jgi:hypothetical protein
MAGMVNPLSLVLSLFLMFFTSLCYSQSFRMEDGSTVTIENPQRIPLSEQDIEQIKQAAKNLNSSDGSSNRVARNEALDVQNYRRQLETELSIERSRRETTREYDRLERDVAKTQRLKEGRDVILYRAGYGDKTYRGGYGNMRR